MCEHYLGHGLTSPPTRPCTSFTAWTISLCVYPMIEWRYSTQWTLKEQLYKPCPITGATNAAVIVTLWTTCSVCHGHVIPLSSPGPICYLAWQRELVLCSVTKTAELVTPVIGQDYRAILSKCTLCCYHHFDHWNIHAVKEVRGWVGRDSKPLPKQCPYVIITSYNRLDHSQIFNVHEKSWRAWYSMEREWNFTWNQPVIDLTVHGSEFCFLAYSMWYCHLSVFFDRWR